MTRLVGVRAVCDGCSAAAATIFCVDHRTVLCTDCDSAQHTNPPHSSHQCVALASAVTALPFCEHCDDAPATTYCQSESTTLCDKCDRLVHATISDDHSRAPIESTLRNRAVEFRGRVRRSSSSRTLTQQPPQKNSLSPSANINPNMPATPCKLAPDIPISLPPSSHTLPMQSKKTINNRLASPPKRRPSKPVAKRKQRRDPSQQQPAIPAYVTDPTAPQTLARGPDIINPDQYPSFLFPPGLSPVDGAYAPFGHATGAPNQPLSDPLLGDPAAQSRQDPDRQAYPMPLSQNYDSIIPGGAIDLQINTPFDPLHDGSKSISDQTSSGPSTRRASDLDELPHWQSGLQGAASGRVPPNTPQANPVAAAAAAAIAAGEMYLLNSVSSGSGSSRERMTPPLNEAPDPAGVAEAATAAAESTVAAVDLNCSSRPSQVAETPAETAGNQNGRSGRGQKIWRRSSEPLIGGPGRGNHIQGEEGQIFEEEVRKLDVDGTRGRASGAGYRDGRLNRPRQDSSGSRNDTSGDLLGQIGGEVVLRQDEDAIGELDISRDEFGFDSMDLGQFDQQGSVSQGFSLLDYKSRGLDWDEAG